MTELSTSLITCSHLSMAFGSKQLFTDLNLIIPRGDFFCLLGANGTGKTTFIKLLLGKETPTDGKIELAAELHNAANIGYVPQFRNIDANYPLSIQNFVALKLSNSFKPWLSKQEKSQVAQALELTGLTAKQQQVLGKASGGEKQRAYLAQAILKQPELLILDEPTASLDKTAKYEVLETVKRLNETAGTTIIFISHDWELVSKYGKHYLEFDNGQYKTGTTADLGGK
ncbi:MAG: ATP-binding cassette domain-containing protein [Liquorilactobacillus ghanensis]|uniref:metal ABC transporter ATP-binding protein n=1 Tax=Liquorilactobacillus TaxID=2767888 RepID=UPI0039E993DE